jgi:hypothetical protein
MKPSEFEHWCQRLQLPASIRVHHLPVNLLAAAGLRLFDPGGEPGGDPAEGARHRRQYSVCTHGTQSPLR